MVCELYLDKCYQKKSKNKENNFGKAGVKYKKTLQK